MCSQYTVKFESSELLEELQIINLKPGQVIDQRLLPHSTAPVVVNDQGSLKLTPMKFSLVPSWSKEAKVKFATHNARIETILEKPTWKQPFISQHCVVPMTAFYESAYTGPLAGNIIKFSDEKNHLLLAAGIFDFWKDLENSNNSFYSFSILTKDPSEFILQYGHDRTPLFIKNDFAKLWLNGDSKNAATIKEDLLRNANHPSLKVEEERALKAGWEKRK